jgi:hypothetical protein
MCPLSQQIDVMKIQVGLLMWHTIAIHHVGCMFVYISTEVIPSSSSGKGILKRSKSRYSDWKNQLQSRHQKPSSLNKKTKKLGPVMP